LLGIISGESTIVLLLQGQANSDQGAAHRACQPHLYSILSASQAFVAVASSIKLNELIFQFD
jgi:hypothetical protein